MRPCIRLGVWRGRDEVKRAGARHGARSSPLDGDGKEGWCWCWWASQAETVVVVCMSGEELAVLGVRLRGVGLRA